jgi:hypothetical protein
LFRAVPENTAESGPAEIAVICQDKVVDPPDKLPTLTVGELTEKCPLCERKLAETVDKTLYIGLLTEFVTTAVTTEFCPTSKVVGTCPAAIVKVWL